MHAFYLSIYLFFLSIYVYVCILDSQVSSWSTVSTPVVVINATRPATVSIATRVVVPVMTSQPQRRPVTLKRGIVCEWTVARSALSVVASCFSVPDFRWSHRLAVSGLPSRANKSLSLFSQRRTTRGTCRRGPAGRPSTTWPLKWRAWPASTGLIRTKASPPAATTTRSPKRTTVTHFNRS